MYRLHFEKLKLCLGNSREVSSFNIEGIKNQFKIGSRNDVLINFIDFVSRINILRGT